MNHRGTNTEDLSQWSQKWIKPNCYIGMEKLSYTSSLQKATC